MTNKDIHATVVQLQRLLEQDYAHREWRVLVSPPPRAGESDEPWVYVHTRTRDFRYRCRVVRPWSVVRRARSLRLLVVELAAEAEQCLIELGATEE